MRNRLILLAVVGASSLVAAVAAWAGNPHFLRFASPELVYSEPAATATVTALLASTAPSTNGDPRVLVDDIVVVGVQEGVTVHLTAPFEAIYVCVNAGGNVPSAANKMTLVGSLTATGDFTAGRNGRATGSLLTGSLPSSSEAAATAGFACPEGQQLEFDRVVFSGLVLSVDGGESVPFDARLESISVHGLTG